MTTQPDALARLREDAEAWIETFRRAEPVTSMEDAVFKLAHAQRALLDIAEAAQRAWENGTSENLDALYDALDALDAADSGGCGYGNHGDPDNTGQCIYCGKVLDAADSGEAT